MIYRLPEMEDEDILKAYVQEHQENGGKLLRENDNFEAGRMSQYYEIAL